MFQSTAGRVLALSVAFSSLLSGCANTLLNKNTLDLASSTDDLIQKQVLFNLANFIDSDLAYPSQVVVSTGTAATTDSISANVSTPLQSGLQATNQVAATVGATASRSQTLTAASTRAIPTAGASGSDSRTQNWSYSAITNPFEAARLMALYRFAVDNDGAKLKRDYPLIYKSISINSTLCVLDTDGKPINVSQEPPPVIDPKSPPVNPVITHRYTRCATSLGSNGSTGVSQGSQSMSQMIVDTYYMKRPLCVLCGSPHSMYVNPELTGNWLHWKSLPGAYRPDNYQEGDTPLGQYGHYELYTSHPEKYAKFALFSLAAATLSDTSGSGGGGGAGGSSAGQKVQSALTCTTNVDGSFFCF
jgi:hypothetical protein